MTAASGTSSLSSNDLLVKGPNLIQPPLQVQADLTTITRMVDGDYAMACNSGVKDRPIGIKHTTKDKLLLGRTSTNQPDQTETNGYMAPDSYLQGLKRLWWKEAKCHRTNK